MGVEAASVRKSFHLLSRLVRDESGQATTEYILILSVVAFGAVSISRAVLKMLEQGVLRLGSELERDLKTGRAPANVWEN